MISPRGFLRRNRGLFAVLVGLLIAWPIAMWLWLLGPRASWTEIDRPSEGPRGPEVAEVAFSPDGRSVFTSDVAGVRVRDVASGRVRELSPGELKGRYDSIQARFLEQSRFVLGYLKEPKAGKPNVHSRRIWEVATARQWVQIPEVGDDSAFSEDVVSEDRSTYAYPPRYERNPGDKVRYAGVWKSAWGPEVRTLPGVAPIALSADGRYLAAGGPGSPMTTILVYDVDSKALVATLPLDPYSGARCLALSADGKILAENRMPGTVLWDVPTATRRAELKTQASPSRFIAGSSMLFMGSTGSVEEPSEAWDLTASPPRPIFRGAIWNVSPDGRRILKAGPDSSGSPKGKGTTELVDLPSGNNFGRHEGLDGLQATSSPDGGLVATHELWTEPDPFIRFVRYLPRAVRPALAPNRVVNRISVYDTRSKRAVAIVSLPEGTTVNPTYELLADGKTLALRYDLMTGPDVTDTAVKIQLWDVPARSLWGMVVASLLVLASGVLFDVRARRRVRLASTLS
jgi:WD40 repeat protein